MALAGLHDAGPPGPADDQTELRWIYTAWLGAFLLKMLGSSWDVSWHFRWLRDDLAPPHLLNSAGTAVVIGLVVFHSYTGYGVDRRALRLMQWGIGLFLLAVPLDIVNHRINGLDITSWSPSHGLLYFGTAVMLAGAIRGWWLYAAPGRTRSLVSLGLWLFFVENVLFPNQHQEYGVLSLRATAPGTPRPSRRCWTSPPRRARPRRSSCCRCPPGCTRPGWSAPACSRCSSPARSSACGGPPRSWPAPTWPTAASRGSCWSRPGFPPSDVPFVLLVGAVLVDLAVTYRVPGWAAGPAVAGLVYAAGAVQEAIGILPPWNWWSILPVAVGFGALWTAVDLLARSAWLARWKVAEEPGAPVAARRRPDRRRSGADAGTPAR